MAKAESCRHEEKALLRPDQPQQGGTHPLVELEKDS